MVEACKARYGDCFNNHVLSEIIDVATGKTGGLVSPVTVYDANWNLVGRGFYRQNDAMNWSFKSFW